CAGLYLRGTSAQGRRCLLFTAVSWLLFLVSITAKEMALATPLYLTAISALFLCLQPNWIPLAIRIRREAARLLPSFALLPVYYFVHVARIPRGSFQAGGAYRDAANWQIILANLHKLPLWIIRFYAGTEPQRMYQSNAVNNLFGALTFVMVAVYWWRNRRTSRLPLLLMLAWTGVYLILPVYSGGYIWHINLPLTAYPVLFGI